MNFNIKITFKAIRYFERMTNTSFLEIDNHQELILNLLYCCLLAHPENNFRMTLEQAIKEFFPKHIDELIQAFSTEMEILNQFGKDSFKSDEKSIDSSVETSPNEEEKLFLSSLIPLLIINCNLDPEFVLNEMDYTDTEMYFASSVEHYHQDMEDKRFWTYLAMTPHISSKAGIKKAEDLVEFTWEKDKKKKEAEKKMEADRQRLIELGFITPDSEEENKTE